MKRGGQTGYAEIVGLAECRSLRLELRLDNVERTGRNTRGETAARASCDEDLIGERPLQRVGKEVRRTYHAVSSPFLSR